MTFGHSNNTTTTHHGTPRTACLRYSAPLSVGTGVQGVHRLSPKAPNADLRLKPIIIAAGARDGALVGGIVGHEGQHGHSGRDAVVGGVGGHLAENHHERHAAHVKNATHNGHGHAAKTGKPATPLESAPQRAQALTYPHFAPAVTTTTTIPKPSFTDKVAGQAEVLVGKATHNPNQVAVGEIRKTEGKAATQGLSGNAAAGTGRY